MNLNRKELCVQEALSLSRVTGITYNAERHLHAQVQSTLTATCKLPTSRASLGFCAAAWLRLLTENDEDEQMLSPQHLEQGVCGSQREARARDCTAVLPRAHCQDKSSAAPLGGGVSHASVYTAEHQWIRRELRFRWAPPSGFPVDGSSEEVTAHRPCNQCDGFNQTLWPSNRPTSLHSGIKQNKNQEIRLLQGNKRHQEKLGPTWRRWGLSIHKVQPRRITHLLRHWRTFTAGGNLLMCKYGMTFSLGDK